MLRTRTNGGASALWYNDASVALNRVLPTFYHDYVGNRYWDQVNGETSFPFTSLRTSNALMWDNSGRLVWAPAQMCTRGQDFSNWGTFADGSAALSGNVAPSGSPAYNVSWTTASPTTGCILSSQPAVVGANMAYSIYLRYVNHKWARVVMYSTSNTSNQVRVWVDLENRVLGTSSTSGGVLVSASIEKLQNGWMRVTLIGNAAWTSTSDGNLLIATTPSDNSTTRVGNGATIEVGSAILEMYGPQAPQTWRSEFNTTGTAWYGPRFTFDPQTLTARGLWTEPTSSNLMVKSETNLGSDWNNASFCTATYIGDQWNRPVNRITVTATGSAQFNYISTASFLPAAATVYTHSMFVKKGNISRVQYTPSANFTDAYCNYNFDTNTITLGGANVVANSGNAQLMQDGWVRLQFSYTSIAVPVAGAPCIVAFIDTDGATRLGGTATNGAYFDCFGFQIETAGVASSYIPTFGTSLTRTTDNTVMNPVGFVDQTKGTFFIKMVVNKPDANSRRIFDLCDNSVSNRIQVTRGSTGALTAVSSVAGVSDFNPTVANTAAAFTTAKAALRYSASGKSIVLNGGTVATNATSPPTSGYTHLYLGHITGFTPGNASFGFLQEVRYYADVSASDAQLQTLTA